MDDLADTDAITLDFATLKARMEEHARGGWVWNEASHTLAHPDHPGLYFRIDPATRRLTLSPELAEQLTTRSTEVETPPVGPEQL